MNISFELIAHNLFIKDRKPNQVVKITDWFHLVVKLFIYNNFDLKHQSHQ